MDADRLRFDFTHFSAMTDEEIAKVEAIVNEQIAKKSAGCHRRDVCRGC